MILYQTDLSIYSTKVRLAAVRKGITLDLREPPGGYRSDAYRTLVPPATIPALVDGPLVLTESDAIIEYLDEVCSGPALMPANPAGRAQARMLSRLVDLRLEAALRALFGRVATLTLEDFAPARRALSLILDLAKGPFALGTTPTLPDFGIAVCLIWLDTLSGEPDPRAANWAAALDHEFAGVLVPYRPLVTDWVAARRAAG
jgi:glutathione S-transferase